MASDALDQHMPPAALPVTRHTPAGSAGRHPLDPAALWRARELLLFLIWSNLKSRHAQSVLGIGWIMVRPVFAVLIFSLFFGRLARMPSDNLPYAVFNLAALVPWFYFADAVGGVSSGLRAHAGVLGRVAFPRVIALLVPLLSKLLDFALSFLLLLGLMAWFGIVPPAAVIYLPLPLLLLVVSALGLGLWLAPLALRYHDVGQVLGIGMQLLLYATPVVFSLSVVPAPLRPLYALYPMVGVIAGFRACLLGAGPMPWDLLAIGGVSALLLLGGGAWYFQRQEPVFDDVM